MKEIWKDIREYYDLYQVSNLGRVRSTGKYGTKGQIIRPCVGRGYYKVQLYKNKKSRCIYVHRLVATAFLPNPYRKEQINHIDGNKFNNRLDNLEWATRDENWQHAIDTGLVPWKTKKVIQLKNGVVINEYKNAYQASKLSGIKYPNIWYVLNGKYHTAGGFEWKYLD